MWRLTETTVKDDEGNEVKTFGITKGKVRIDDICINRKEIEIFIRRLNENNASEIHAYELTENFLAER